MAGGMSERAILGALKMTLFKAALLVPIPTPGASDGSDP